MQIQIDVPPLLHRCLLWAVAFLTQSKAFWNGIVASASSLWTHAVNVLFNINRHAFVSVTIILLLFWPLLLSLIMAFATAWTWIFWLVTSILFGLLQLVYVAYQFAMIACNIFGLSVLKTYSIVSAQIVSVFELWPGISSKKPNRKSQRLLWKQRLEDAGNYENFLKIRIENKEEDELLEAIRKRERQRSDSALPKLSRTQSFTIVEGSGSGSPPRVLPGSSGSQLTRNRSFSGDVGSLATLLSVVDPVVSEELGERTADLLMTTTIRLRETRLAAVEQRTEEAAHALIYLLSGVMKRNHLKLDDIIVENATSIAWSGHYGLTNASRQAIRAYLEEVEKGLDWISESAGRSTPTSSPTHNNNNQYSNNNTDSISPTEQQQIQIGERISLVRRMKQNMGRTALMLSGGGAQAMYHLGIVRALIESKQYHDIKVISGTSGGSITAAMCAIKTPEELHKDVCVKEVSTDYGNDGRMKAENIRWFPTITEMATYWLKHKLMVDSALFRRTCEFYFGTTTFEEAFQRTGKHVCITVSASRASGDTAQRLLLNHISTPHVTVASAVAASCALPGVMSPAKLMAKCSDGNTLEPFEVDGVEWIDGSVQADLPFQRISTLFAVSSFIVSQTNFHIVPLLNKDHHPNQDSLYWRVFQTMEWDIRSRALKLSRLGLFPRFFGEDISKVFKQRYHGNLTIVPRFTTMQTFGLKALSNPTVKDMEGYLKYGQIATWPYLNAIRDMIRVEKALDDCLGRLEDRMRSVAPDVDWSVGQTDDIDSIASSSVVQNSSTNRVRVVGRPPNGISVRDRESERLRKRMVTLEEENHSLRKQLERLQKQSGSDKNGHKPNDVPAAERAPSLADGSEGGVWGLVRKGSKVDS